MKRLVLKTMVAGVGIFLAATEALALPATTASLSVQTDVLVNGSPSPLTKDTPGSLAYSHESGDYVYSSAASANWGTSTATTIASGFFTNQPYASSELSFYFQVNGPSSSVPIRLTYSTSEVVSIVSNASPNYDGSADAGLGVGGIGGKAWYVFADTGQIPNTLKVDSQGGHWGQGWGVTETGTMTFLVATNVPYAVNLTTGASSSNNLNASASISVTGLNIDPSFGNASDYSLQLGPNSISAVPEPSTWAMLLLGFAGIGVVTYRQQRAAA